MELKICPETHTESCSSSLMRGQSERSKVRELEAERTEPVQFSCSVMSSSL